MVQNERSELSPEKRDQSKVVAADDSGEKPKESAERDRAAKTKISVEEHLAGLWNVLGLGD
jgi:hypothetical protein